MLYEFRDSLNQIIKADIPDFGVCFFFFGRDIGHRVALSFFTINNKISLGVGYIIGRGGKREDTCDDGLSRRSLRAEGKTSYELSWKIKR